jgi:hypothetical protein
MEGRWQLIVFPFEAASATAITAVGPRDGANRYDAAFIADDTIVTVSTRGGIPNLEKQHLPSGTATPLTNVTGAGVAPAFNPADRSIWFLALYSRGYDVRRIEGRVTAAVRSADLDTRFSPAVPAAGATLTRFTANPVSEPKAFGLRPRFFRWIPQPFADADGGSIGLGLVSADLIGRSEILVAGVAGDASQSRGVVAELTWRGLGPSLRARGFLAQQQPSASRSPVPFDAALDVELRGGEVAIDRLVQFDAWGYRYKIGASAAAVRGVGRAPAWSTSASATRALAFVDWSASWTKRGDASSLTATIGATTTRGTSFDRSFTRGTTSVGLSLRTPLLLPISASATYGATNSDAAPFEQFALGGGRSPLLDQSGMSQRISMPAIPLGTSIGSSVAAYRVAVSTQPLSWYFWSASTSASGSSFDVWHRVVGVEWNQSVGHIPLAGTPAARAQVGLGESLDAPFRQRLRAYVSLVLNP